MKWFHIQFTSSELYAGNDAVLITQYITFSHSVNHPEELNLFSLKFKMDEGTAYYISAPDQIAYKVKAVLARFDSSEVSRPNLKLLTLEFGRDKLNNTSKKFEE